MTRPEAACDTSVLLPALLSWHEDHSTALDFLQNGADALIAHTLSEAFSVGTRLPEPHRIAPITMIALLEGIPLEVVGLAPDRHLTELRRLAQRGVVGGSTYDGIIAATANEHHLELVTFDRRARLTYDALDVRVRFLG